MILDRLLNLTVLGSEDNRVTMHLLSFSSGRPGWQCARIDAFTGAREAGVDAAGHGPK